MFFLPGKVYLDKNVMTKSANKFSFAALLANRVSYRFDEISAPALIDEIQFSISDGNFSTSQTLQIKKAASLPTLNKFDDRKTILEKNEGLDAIEGEKFTIRVQISSKFQTLLQL